MTAVHSVAGVLASGCALVRRGPFRAPHHTISDAGLIGGGNPPRPGEVSLAHHGVLFLDEVLEFRRHVLEALRQPLEDGRVVIARAAHSVTFPARFLLVGAMNPCPCGYAGDARRMCVCAPGDVARYRARLSGPLIDRIDIRVDVRAVAVGSLAAPRSAERSRAVRSRVDAARLVQRARYASLRGRRVQRTCARPVAGYARQAGRRWAPPPPEGGRARGAHRAWLSSHASRRADDRRSR